LSLYAGWKIICKPIKGASNTQKGTPIKYWRPSCILGATLTGSPHHEEMLNLCTQMCCRYPDVVLATLLCIRTNLCRRRFEIKLNGIVFVGFPMQMPAAAAGAASSTHASPNTASSQPQLVQPSPKREQSSTVSYNIVFALKVMFFQSLEAPNERSQRPCILLLSCLFASGVVRTVLGTLCFWVVRLSVCLCVCKVT